MQSQASTQKVLNWQFPLPRPHTGIPLGNGVQGILVWGGESLTITVARAGFWDRRGGNEFTTRATFPLVRKYLEANDAKGIGELFAITERAENDMRGVAEGVGRPDRPYQIGGGRIELAFPRGLKPQDGLLRLANGVVEIVVANAHGESHSLTITQSMDEELAWIEMPAELAADVQVTCKPSWDWVKDSLSNWGVPAPRSLDLEDGGGFVQELPEDEDLALVWRQRDGVLYIATALGECEDACKAAVSLARQKPELRPEFYWKGYWRDVPSVKLPDAELQHFWDLALYKQAGITTPGGVAATLQGPWMEEYQLPPWSNDYHFNINAEMIYWPALATNRLEHFKPLWDLIHSWMPRLKDNGEKFFGRPGSLMLPHAVDDECQVVGSFWTGTIDHACTAWMAQMAWQQYRYGLDEGILKETAWPLLNGAFEGYWAMAEERDGKLSLPVSVSPEYRGSQMNAWGRDASFQLAAWRMVAEKLIEAAKVLGHEADPRWHEALDKVPHYALVNGRIGLWEGLELEESHRHHSHLAAIFPFVSLDPFAQEHWSVVARSIEFWNHTGSGNWTGWCTPWAAILCARLELPDASVTWLHWLLDNFTNEGWGTLHNADFAGTCGFHDGSLGGRRKPPGEVMQMDATMGYLVAVTELLVQNRRDGLYVLPALPRRWKELEFDGIRCEGAFLVGATVKRGKVTEIRVRSEKGGKLELHHGFQGGCSLDGTAVPGTVLTAVTTPGQVLTLHPLM